jgi:hypothetical protein
MGGQLARVRRAVERMARRTPASCPLVRTWWTLRRPRARVVSGHVMCPGCRSVVEAEDTAVGAGDPHLSGLGAEVGFTVE